jgi:hypothetical protein
MYGIAPSVIFSIVLFSGMWLAGEDFKGMPAGSAPEQTQQPAPDPFGNLVQFLFHTPKKGGKSSKSL